jgi:hypothetical protein
MEFRLMADDWRIDHQPLPWPQGSVYIQEVYISGQICFQRAGKQNGITIETAIDIVKMPELDFDHDFDVDVDCD